MGVIRAAKFCNSPRLKHLLKVLADGNWYTTLDLTERTRSCAVHTDIAELRANGFAVERRYFGLVNDRRVYEYRLTGAQGAA